MRIFLAAFFILMTLSAKAQPEKQTLTLDQVIALAQSEARSLLTRTASKARPRLSKKDFIFP